MIGFSVVGARRYPNATTGMVGATAAVPGSVVGMACQV